LNWQRVVYCLLCLLIASFLNASLLGADWTSLRIVPSDVVLATAGQSQHFLVLARSPGGLEEDVTAQSTLVSSAPEVASVDARLGLLTARKRGQSEIRVRVGRLQSSTIVKVGDRPMEVPVQFSPDVISILTTKGCNNSGCHGSPAGQSGFKLSLFGYDVAADRDMILQQHGGRRVDMSNPEKSLLLRKPLFDVPHGGGRLMTRDSDEYKTILKWLQQGGRLDADGPRVSRLDLFPTESVLTGTGARMRVVVIGRLSDGTTRDMTREVRYSSNEETVASVGPDGVITAGANGLATVLARGMGKVSAVQVGVVQRRADAEFPKLIANNFIDELVYEKQRKLNVRPAPLCSDREFVRRVFLDTIGVLPTPDEVERFLNDREPGKRERLIESLLDRPEYADLWTVKFEDWFRNNQLNSQGRSMGIFKEWIRDWLAQDRPYDEVVRALITSKGDTFGNPAANFWHPATDFMLKRFDVNKVTPTVSRLFLGIRLECAECHNHPLENFTQDDFYGVSAFFARMRVKHGTAEYRRTWFLDEEGEIEHPVSKKPVRPKILSGNEPAFAADDDRRVALANWITSPGNPYFARATVNRIWNEYFQAGIVEPFDDFRSTNAPTNRELLDRLAACFSDSGFRLKALHRVILNSRTYQLSSRRKDGTGATLEHLLFARYQARQLPAETLLDSIAQVTGVPHAFRNYPVGMRAMEVHVPDSPDHFLVTFGLPRRDILCERTKSPTLSQALHMINGETIMQKIQKEDNVLAAYLKKGWSDEQIVEALYLRAYARPLLDTERDAIREFLNAEISAGRSRRRALEGVLWSVLNSMEFKVNH
jgi:hypothetical protein